MELDLADSKPIRFILASASPRRRQMLGDLGIDFEIIPPHIPEDAVGGETPEEHTARLALGKALAIAADRPEALVLGVDTTVVIDGLVLGKPADADDAFRMLSRLAGRWHVVVTAFALVAADFGIRRVRTETSRVFLRPLAPERIRWYVRTGEPMDKAGAYAIQGIGAGLVKKIEGSYTCVVGLPLAELIEEIEGLFGPDWLFERK
jgi:septum formation protein